VNIAQVQDTLLCMTPGYPNTAVSKSQAGRIAELSDIATGKVPGRRLANDVTLFFSVGLAGTEVVVAGEVLRRARESVEM
jgi:alanine dehydrogenase